jgi:hypothetical protein
MNTEWMAAGGEDDNKKSKDEGWQDLLGQKKTRGITKEVARRLLELNPKMREGGLDTAAVMDQSKRARDQEKIPEKTQARPGAQQPISDDISKEVGRLKRELEVEEATIAREEAGLKSELAKLVARRESAKLKTRDAVASWLEKNDPQVRSPVTQQVLADEKPTLERVGFTMSFFLKRRT